MISGSKEPKLTAYKVISVENRKNLGDKEKDFVSE